MSRAHPKSLDKRLGRGGSGSRATRRSNFDRKGEKMIFSIYAIEENGAASVRGPLERSGTAGARLPEGVTGRDLSEAKGG